MFGDKCPDYSAGARLAQPVECKALNLVVVGSSPTVGAAAETLAAAPSGPAVAALRASLASAVRQGQAGGHIPWGGCVWMHPCVQDHGHQRAAPGHSNFATTGLSL